ncbi:REP element-mobilizing transposase RayT [Salegentibacter echinorum]|uniref:REP element-mobilizing transposase RayT n=1 Tax=Salegentibacter echinorum TaxID=1073325 RepID=A0A1M5DQM5_SALEC|nr:IS200/IS605 family transposase [Salegentibacter echinorum]SHF69215.1 REP element-mobilizing transposase RayT [Salegentibacter echinorum]
MANTYSQIYIHCVFVVKGRQNLISKRWKDELYKYITGIVSNEDQKLIAINGMADHVHILLGIKPNKNLSELIRDIKANSSRFINTKKWILGKFEWQKGFGAFSCGQAQLDLVINYIQKQEIHHKKMSFREEYQKFLKHHDIKYKTDYLFEQIEKF